MDYNNQNPFEEERNHEEQPLTESTEKPISTSTVATATQENATKPKKDKTSFKSFFAGLLGGTIPALIVVMLIMNNIIPVNQVSENTMIASTNHEAPESEPDYVTTLAADDSISASNIEEASEAVVGVINLRRQSIWTTSEEAGSGSGIVYKKEDGYAYIVTNHHVVEGAEEVEIVLNNDERIRAKVLGSDELTDLAILQVNGEKINTVASLGSSEDIKVGETVLAIGNPLGMEFANSLTKGIISGLNRSVSVDTNGDRVADWITEVIQTDAAINPGNSGGALVDVDGKVIGINSMKIARQEVEGIGFAIPIDTALPIMEQLETKGEVARPFIGISTAAIHQVPPQYRHNVILPDEVEGGMVIANVEPGSPAERAGLQQFDVITKIDGHPITSILELRKYMYSETMIGDTVSMEIYRNGEAHTIELELADREAF